MASPYVLTREDFSKGTTHVQSVENRYRSFLCQAQNLYTGEQHTRLMEGVKEVRRKTSFRVDTVIVSAGYGVISGVLDILPYEHTFHHKPLNYVQRWGDFLQMPVVFRNVVSTSYGLGLLFLGKEYLDACRFDSKIYFGGFTLLFCCEAVAKKLSFIPNLRVVVLEKDRDTKRFNCGSIGLKGEVGRRFLKELAKDSNSIMTYLGRPSFDILEWLSLRR